jgi:hypothetical protein
LSIKVRTDENVSVTVNFPKLQVGRNSKNIYLMSSPSCGFRLTGVDRKYMTGLSSSELMDWHGEVVISNGD